MGMYGIIVIQRFHHEFAFPNFEVIIKGVNTRAPGMDNDSFQIVIRYLVK